MLKTPCNRKAASEQFSAQCDANDEEKGEKKEAWSTGRSPHTHTHVKVRHGAINQWGNDTTYYPQNIGCYYLSKSRFWLYSPAVPGSVN